MRVSRQGPFACPQRLSPIAFGRNRLLADSGYVLADIFMGSIASMPGGLADFARYRRYDAIASIARRVAEWMREFDIATMSQESEWPIIPRCFRTIPGRVAMR